MTNILFNSINHNRSNRALLGALAFVAPMVLANAAQAQEGCAPDTCGLGFTCVEYSAPCPTTRVDLAPDYAVNLATAATPPSAKVASAGIDIALPAPPEPTAGAGTAPESQPVASPDTTTTECVPQIYTRCEPANCTVNSDCGTDMVCAESSWSECSGGASKRPICPSGEECTQPPPEPVVCTTHVENKCALRWPLPCDTAADCGAGFTCEEQESCYCTGSTAPVPVDAPNSGDASVRDQPSSAPVCGCSPSGVSACKVIETACTTDAECLPNWTCVNNPEGYCWASSDGTGGCTTPDPARICQPPYSSSHGADTVDLGGKGEPASANQGSTVGTGGPTGETPQAPVPTTPNDNAGDAAVPPVEVIPVRPHGGCSVTENASGSASGLVFSLAGLAAAFGLRRRNRRG